MRIHTIKQGDTSPALKATLKTPTGVAVDLTGATVRFSMRNKAGVVKVNEAAASFEGDGSDGRVVYNWDATDTDTAGKFEAEFEVTFAGGDVETFPNKSYFDVLINAQVA